MRAVFAVAFNQLTRVAADRTALVTLLAIPLVLNFILGISLQNAFSPDWEPNRPLRAAVFAAGEAAPAAAVADALTSDAVPDWFDAERAGSEDEALAAVRERQADAAVIVPAGFPDEEVRIVAEPGTVRSGVVEEVVRQAVLAITDPALAAVPVDVRSTMIGPEAGTREDPARPARAMDYYAAGMAVLMALHVGARGTETLLEDRRNGVYLRARAAGLGRTGYVLGKMTGSVLIALAFLAAMALLTRLLFGVRWGDPAAWALLTGAGALAVAGVNAVLASLVRRPELFDAVTGAGYTIMGMLGGSMMPLYVFPDVLARISRLVPNRWMLEGYLEILAGAGPQAVAREAGVLVAIAAVLFLLGMVVDTLSARAAGEA